MKKRLLNNLGLKIASLILAFLIWLIIINVNDPVMTKSIFNVPVTVTNASYIESMGKSYQVLDGYDTVSVTVRGNRSVVENMTADSIKATANLTEIVNLDSDPITVPVRVSAAGLTNGSISANPGTIEIELEEMVSADFVITGSAGNTTPADGYQVGTLTPSVEKVTITGPNSILSKIDRVEAPVNVTGISSDTTLSSTLVVYDKNGEALTATQMGYLKFDIDQSGVTVRVTLYSVVRDVPIVTDGFKGKPATGYQVSGMTVTPSAISLAGTKDGLQNLTDIGGQITIDPSLIDVSSRNSSFDVKIDNLASMLPENVYLANGASSAVVVSVEILPLNSKSFEIPASSISKLNQGAGLTCVFSATVIDVGVKGTDEQLSALTADEIGASVDLSGLGEGTYTLPVAITLPSGYVQVSDVTINAVLSNIAVASPASTASDAPAVISP